MIILVAVMVAIHAICDAACDGIKDIRTHKGQHPYRDFWHLCKHLSRMSLILLGMLMILVDDKLQLLAVLGFSCIWYWFLWNHIYVFRAQEMYECDESFHISTGIKWLDKLFGFHW